jgi:hypothetical protein
VERTAAEDDAVNKEEAGVTPGFLLNGPARRRESGKAAEDEEENKAYISAAYETA